MNLEALFRNGDGQTIKGVLFFGDNLDVLRKYLADESVDLIYLDPPFNSRASYNILFREPAGTPSAAQIKAFEDTWHWGDESEEAFRELVRDGPEKVSNIINSLVSGLGRNDVSAYLVMMGIRVLELHRVLKRTGSLYLHCDPTMSHYIKLVLDSVFGPKCFQNEIIWKRTFSHKARRWGRIHDVILFYTKNPEHYKWNPPIQEYDRDYIKKFFRFEDERGKYRLVILTGPGITRGESGQPWRGYDPGRVRRHWAVPQKIVEEIAGPEEAGKMGVMEKLELLLEEGRVVFSEDGVPSYKLYLDELVGVPGLDIWTDIPPLSAQAREKLNYPTQKPEKLLERIISASSDEGDVIFDPFCGCGTTVSVAQRTGRLWIGIDITHLAVNLIKARLKDQFNLIPGEDYVVHGEPVDLAGADALAKKSRYEFEYWALSLLTPARPTKSQETDRRGTGPDTGYDGMIYLADGDFRKPVYKRILIQVKSGRVGVREIRELISVVERENDAVAGILITLREPTRNMLTEALSAGEFQHEATGTAYPKIQIASIEDLLEGKRPHLPENWLVMSTRSAPRAGPGRNRSLL